VNQSKPGDEIRADSHDELTSHLNAAAPKIDLFWRIGFEKLSAQRLSARAGDTPPSR
jgi:hypothetical protein